MAENDNGRTCRTIMLFSPKGGVGKTTLALHILVAASRAGAKAIGVDFDSQQTLRRWAELREQDPKNVERPGFAIGTADLDDWQEVLDALEDFDLAVLDLPPGIKGHEAMVNSFAARVDLVVIPTGPSAFDRQTVIPWMTRFVERGLAAQFCFNRAPQPHVRSYRDTKRELVQHGAVVPVDIPHREDIVYASERGLAVLDVDRARGRAEFETLWEHLRREVRL